MTYPMTPVQLAAELGHELESRPGLKVRNFLRERYPEHDSYERWLLSKEQADEVREHFKNDHESSDSVESLALLMQTIPATSPLSRAMFRELHKASQREYESVNAEISAALIPIVNAIVKLEGELSGHVGAELKRNALASLFKR